MRYRFRERFHAGKHIHDMLDRITYTIWQITQGLDATASFSLKTGPNLLEGPGFPPDSMITDS